MKKALLPLAAALALLSRPAAAQPGPGIVPEPQGKPAAAAPAPQVYDESADGRADVAAAAAKAQKEGKYVLVTLGANWCGWCRALDGLLAKDEKVAAALGRSYVPVKVDVGRMKAENERVKKNLDLAAGWGAEPKKGIPLLVVLDGDGKVVKVQETGSLEAGKGHDPAKVIAFLDATAKR
jgi:thiol:disulfide interchange protein